MTRGCMASDVFERNDSDVTCARPSRDLRCETTYIVQKNELHSKFWFVFRRTASEISRLLPISNYSVHLNVPSVHDRSYGQTAFAPYVRARLADAHRVLTPSNRIGL